MSAGTDNREALFGKRTGVRGFDFLSNEVNSNCNFKGDIKKLKKNERTNQFSAL